MSHTARIRYTPGEGCEIVVAGLGPLKFRDWPALCAMLNDPYPYEDLYTDALSHPWAWCWAHD